LPHRNLKGTNMTDFLTLPPEAQPFAAFADADPNMTCRQAAILALVAAHPGRSNNIIARTLCVSAPVITRAVDKLVALGLMTRITDDEDRRKVCLTVTAAGRRLLREMTPGA
jgi:DNA-binding MarR family transcriptional regulator